MHRAIAGIKLALPVHHHVSGSPLMAAWPR